MGKKIGETQLTRVYSSRERCLLCLLWNYFNFCKKSLMVSFRHPLFPGLASYGGGYDGGVKSSYQSGYSSGYSGSSGFHSEPWGGGVWGSLPLAPPPRGSSMSGGGVTEERRTLSSQLSALFPPRTVQEIMDTHPHVADMSQLISLIQRTTPLS